MELTELVAEYRPILMAIEALTGSIDDMVEVLYED